MSQPTAEDIVRRATAAFNAGQPRRGAQALRAGPEPRSPAIPCSAICWPPCCFRKARSNPARGHIETSLAKRPGNAAAHLLAARIARAARDFDGALSHLDRAIAIAPQREAFLEKARTLDQASLHQASLRPQAREAWQAILKVVPRACRGRGAARTAGMGGWRPRRSPHPCSNAPSRAMLPHRSGSISASSARICATTTAPRAPIARRSRSKPDHAEAALNLGIVLQETGDLDGAMRAYAQAYRLRPQHVRHHRDGADLGAARPAVARRGGAAPLTRRAIMRPRRARKRLR